MSNRTLIEINHDYRPSEEMLEALRRYVSSADKEHAKALERFGVTVISIRHHSGNFYIKGTPDGFPVKTVPARQP